MLDPSTIAALAQVGAKGVETQYGIMSKAYDSGQYYGKYDAAKDVNKALGPLQPNAYGELDLSALYSYKPMDYYGVMSSTDPNKKSGIGERIKNSFGNDGFQIGDIASAPSNFLHSYTSGYGKAANELSAYKKKLARDAMGYNQGVATRRAYYDKLLEDQYFDYSKFYG